MQLCERREYCNRRGWDVSAEFTDIGISGAKERRPQLDQLLAGCPSDASTRSSSTATTASHEAFPSSSTPSVSSTPSGSSSCHCTKASTRRRRTVGSSSGFSPALRNFERELIRDRVRSGIAAARARGKRLGRPRRDVDSAQVAALRAEGRSWRDVGRVLGAGVATARAAFQARAKNPSELAPVSD
jgi:putative DNA-invertase from lambdoid prophage Rac